MALVMNIALSSSKKMFLPAYVTLTSMFENHQNVCCHAYILHSELEQEQIESFQKLAEKYHGQIIECRVDKERLAGVREHERVSVETYYRLFLTDYLPEDAERVLVIGTDVIINQNIEEYYNQDFEGKCIVVCKDFLTRKSVLEPEWYVLKFLREEGYSYFNADVLLYNMHELRKIDLPGKFFEVEQEFHDLLTIMDQDILNYLFYDKVKYVDENLYNFCARGFFSEEWNYDRVERETKIIHYSGPVKPWDMQEFYCEIEYIVLMYIR